MAGQFIAGLTSQVLPQNCVVNTTPPTFAGIATLTARQNGSLRATWLAATTSGKDPVRYAAYIKVGSSLAPGDFIAANRIPINSGVLSVDIFALADQITLLVYGTTYAVGIRAIDSQGYESSTTTYLSAISNGVLPDYMNNIANALGIVASSVAAGAGQQMSVNTNDTTMTIDTDGVV